MTTYVRHGVFVLLLSCLGLAACKSETRPGTQPAQEEKALGPWNLAGKPPHLIAHYMAWYTTGGGSDEGAWDHWKWKGGQANHDPNRVTDNGRRDIASAVYPLIGPYDSSSPAVIRYHLATARAARIQALAVIWYGPLDPVQNRRVELLLDEAQKQGMKICLCYEEKINFSPYRRPQSRSDLVRTATEDLTHLIEHYGRHPAYLTREGKPFVFQFNYWGTGRLGPNNLTPDEWKQVFAALPSTVAYGRQNLDLPHHPPIPAAYVWWTEDESWLRKFSEQAAALKAQGRLDFYMTMMCPGFDDTGVWGWGAGPRKSKEYGLPVLKKTFDLALLHEPELVQIVTWNDFNEATVVEPTADRGFEFLDAIETWWGQRFGRPVNLQDNWQPYREYVKTCSESERALLPAVREEVFSHR